MTKILFNSQTLALDHREFDPEMIIVANKIGGIFDKKLALITSYLPPSPHVDRYNNHTSRDFINDVSSYVALAIGLLWKHHVVFSIGSTYGFGLELFKEDVEYILYGEEAPAIESLIGVFGSYGYFNAGSFLDMIFYDAWILTLTENLDLYIDLVSIMNQPAQQKDIIAFVKSTLETYAARENLIYDMDTEVLGAVEFTLEQNIIEHIGRLNNETNPQELQLMI